MIWRPMAQDTVVDWEALLDQFGAWDIFKADDDDTESIRRSQMPALPATLPTGLGSRHSKDVYG